MLDSGGNGVVGCERRVHNDTEMFYLKVGLVQGFEGTSVIKVVVKWDGEIGVCDGSDKGSMFSGRWERVEVVTMDRDID